MIIIFWDMTPCGSYKNRRFGGSYRLHFQGERVRAGTERNSKLLPIQDLTVSLCTCSYCCYTFTQLKSLHASIPFYLFGASGIRLETSKTADR
jgi:hypothetical protein